MAPIFFLISYLRHHLTATRTMLYASTQREGMKSLCAMKAREAINPIYSPRSSSNLRTTRLAASLDSCSPNPLPTENWISLTTTW